MVYALGNVRPHVRACAEEVGKKFRISVIHGVGMRDGKSDHPKGLALDFMCGKATGDAVASFLQANANRYGIKYIIWWQRIWEFGKDGWRPMKDRGGDTLNHKDHVHVSFFPSLEFPENRGIEDIPVIGDDIDAARDTVAAAGKVAAWLTDTRNWLRLAMLFSGSLLILFAVISIDKIRRL